MTTFSNSCLAGRLYLVTGASSGLGKAAAMRVAACGGRLIICGRNRERLGALAAELGSTCIAEVGSDICDADATADLVERLASNHGALDGVFHSAGVEMIKPMRYCKQAHISDVFGASVNGAYGIARASAKRGIVRDGGSLVLMSSVAARSGQPGLGAYSGAKAAIEGLVRSLAAELASRSVRVNAVAAGAVVTEMHDRATELMGQQSTSEYEARHMFGFGKPIDIANAVMFLLSDASSWITGSTLAVDGGYGAR